MEVTNSSITFSWSRPFDAPKETLLPLNYTVCLGLVGEHSSCEMVGKDMVYKATGLKSETNYVLSVKAESAGGFGPPGIVNQQTFGGGKCYVDRCSSPC